MGELQVLLEIDSNLASSRVARDGNVLEKFQEGVLSQLAEVTK